MLVVAEYLLEAKADGQLGSASDEESETAGCRLLGPGEKINEGLGILLLVAFVERIYDYSEQRGTGLALVKRFQEKLLELLLLGLVDDGRVVLDCGLEVRGQFRQLDDKLSEDCGEEHGGSAAVAFAFLKEEAGAGHLSFGKLFGHGSRDGRLAGAGHAAQPEDAFSVGILHPCMDVSEKVNAGIGVAPGVVLVIVGVECGAFCNRKLGEDYFAIDVEDLVGLAVDVEDLVGLVADVEDLSAICSMSAAQ